MKLTRIGKKPVEKKSPAPMSSGERALFRIKMDAELPYGKFKGRTIGYIVKNEQWYWNYLEDNNLMIEWNLLELKSEPVRKPKEKLWDPIVTSTGEVWMGIRIIPNKEIKDTCML